MSEYVKTQRIDKLPRIPLRGEIDLTYRCNNNCRHCWLWIPENSPEKQNELPFDEIRRIVDEARKMGCREWSISGGEPMLRPDFIDIFDFITSNGISYSLNTNGSLITPKIARIMKRKGAKMVALYGATAEVHDHITRNPGSFDAMMQGFAYLQELGVGFSVQIVPMKDNYHQYKEMIELAKSLSPFYRIGATWLYLSSNGSRLKNREIKQQRLSPKKLFSLDNSDFSINNRINQQDTPCRKEEGDVYLFSSCIENRNSFHIDPYGKVSFCCFIKDPALRFNVMENSFKKCWDELIPSLKEYVKADKEYFDKCGSCKIRQDCQWCPAYGFLEKRHFSSKVDYLCKIAKNTTFKNKYYKKNMNFFRIADLNIRIDSDHYFKPDSFSHALTLFKIDKVDNPDISIRHKFSIPIIKRNELGREVFKKPPWIIYHKNNSWIYCGVSSLNDNDLSSLSIFNMNYTEGQIFHRDDKLLQYGNLNSITLFPTDQIIFAQVLADRNKFYLHSSGISIDQNGYLFVGHSGAGKSTIAKLFKKSWAKILCDDRIIVENSRNGAKIYGTWHHGELPEVSPDSAQLTAIFFLEKSTRNILTKIENPTQIIISLIKHLIKPFATAHWWNKTLISVEAIAKKVPSYRLYFTQSEDLIDIIRNV